MPVEKEMLKRLNRNMVMKTCLSSLRLIDFNLSLLVRTAIMYNAKATII